MRNGLVVLGATGHVGRHLLEHLAGGPLVRAVHQHASNAPKLEGVASAQADLTDPEAARQALEGAEAVYLAPPEEGPEPLETHLQVVRNTVAAAQAAGVEHLVMHSALHAGRAGIQVRMLEAHGRAEDELKRGDVPWTILRPGLFLDTLLDVGPHARRENIWLPFPPSLRFGAVAADDVARAAATLLESGPQETTYDLHIPDGVSGQDIAHAAGELLERGIEAAEDPEGVTGFASRLGLGPAEQELYEELLRHVAAGEYLGEPEAFQRAFPSFRYTELARFLHDERFVRRREFTLEAK